MNKIAIMLLAGLFVAIAVVLGLAIPHRNSTLPEIGKHLIFTESVSRYVYKKIKVVETCYQPVEDQCGSSPWVTASGDKINALSFYFWCAVSPDLEEEFGISFGDTIQVGNNIYVVKDRTSSDVKRTIDIVIPPEENLIFKDNNYLYIIKYIGKEKASKSQPG